MRGYRCLKSIYLTIHQPELEPAVTPELQALFDQGNLVGETARRYIPGGTLVNCKPWEFGAALSRTRDLIADGTPIIYEAAFEYLGCYARADIIQYSPDTKRWSIYEVKSTTSIKPEHLDDVGLQTWIMAKSGLPIEKIHIMHLNRECRYPDLNQLFIQADVTQEMREHYPSVQHDVKAILSAITQPDIPAVPLGPYCQEPTPCPFLAHCWQAIPKMSMFNLPGMRERKWDLYAQGIINLEDPRLTELTEVQQRIVHSSLTGERYINPTEIKAALQTWVFPLVFLDFETINPAIPRYHGTRPYQQVPFQFSVHHLETLDSEMTHKEFLFAEPTDPRPALIQALLNDCGTSGSIVAYYGKFESDRIKELAEFSPEHSDALLALVERIVDPLPIFRQSVYDPKFAGSFSLKYVAPAILGSEQSYAGMDVANGGEAQRAFEAMINAEGEEKAKIRQGLLDYCRQDTLVMAELVRWLYRSSSCGKEVE